MLLALLLYFDAPGARDQIDWSHPNGNAVRLVDNGFCIGKGWVTLRRGEVATVDYGPDFNVYRVKGPGAAAWGAYSGFAGQSQPDRQRILMTKDGVAVYRGTGDDGKFDGYFVGDKQQQNHIFGTMFADKPTDAAFFDRIRLGNYAARRCEEYWKQ